VRWRWQWVTYFGNKAATFDFTGSLRPDNTITGMVKRRETGFSLNFTAKRQSIAAAPTEGAPAVQGVYVAQGVPDAPKGTLSQMGIYPNGLPAPAPTSSPAALQPPGVVKMLSGNVYQRNMAGTLNPITGGQPSPTTPAPPPRNNAPGPYDQFDPQDIATAQAMFPSNQQQQLQWLVSQKQQKTANEINRSKPLIFPTR